MHVNADPDSDTALETSYKAQIDAFRAAYAKQTAERRIAEAGLTALVENRMNAQVRGH